MLALHAFQSQGASAEELPLLVRGTTGWESRISAPERNVGMLALARLEARCNRKTEVAIGPDLTDPLLRLTRLVSQPLW